MMFSEFISKNIETKCLETSNYIPDGQQVFNVKAFKEHDYEYQNKRNKRNFGQV